MLAPSLADRLNRNCHCVGTDVDALHASLDAHLRQQGVAAPLLASHPYLFAQSPVFLSRDHLKQIEEIVAAVESVASLPAYRALAALNGPSVTPLAQATSPRGIFLGYDFHISPTGPKLIEINTNAGGAMLNVALMRAQQVCCPEVLRYLASQPGPAELEDVFMDMFKREWQLTRGDQILQTVALVDDQPTNQYLYPEFLLFKQLFEARGIRCVIAPPEELTYKDGGLWLHKERIDLVYNRLTDFYLEEPAHAALAEAWRGNAVVLTPHPEAYAIYANKRMLVHLSSGEILQNFGASKIARAVLTNGIPRTLLMDAATSEEWWNTRSGWFFKPATGFGSRGSYRGDKLTKRVFAEIVDSDYVAQEIVSPAEREIAENGAPLKFDIRAYVYEGRVQLLAARLYRGQTTNFRTAGGGFAPIYLT